MTNTVATPPVDRLHIHKSCRTIESLLSLLNDYSEAATTFAAIQKKIAKALRDTAALKSNAQFAANAFTASASILEVLADVDSKFAKLADKESRSIVHEFKKWLKKLARDEKAHDERMDDANARIKHASQAYEKKSKRGAKDASEEHARYINLLSVIGPEMSQEKYNHARQVTQHNTLVTFSVAASVSRIADAEWTRVCECMRRISPTIGSLGEWRSLCEGAWTGPLPDDLPDMSSETVCTKAPPVAGVSEWGRTAISTPVRRLLPIPPEHMPAAPVPTATNHNQDSINSITTLSAFPLPPTHFPIPLATNEAELLRQQIQLQNSPSIHSRVGTPNPDHGASAPPTPILSDSPKLLATAELPESITPSVTKSSHSSKVFQGLSSSHQSPVTLTPPEAPPIPEPVIKEVIRQTASGGDLKELRRPSLPARPPLRPIPPFKKAEQPSTEKEFGVHTDDNKSAFKSHSVDAAKKSLERTDSTHSAGSNVAALRNRYTHTVETPSQGLKDIPRLPMSVSEIASRYQPADEPLSPRRTASPIVDRFPPDTPRTAAPTDENEVRKRKQHIERLPELEHDRRHRRPETSDGLRGPRRFQHRRGSQSITHLDVPSSTTMTMTTTTSSSGASHLSTPQSPRLPPKDHAPFCGCDACSVSKYKATDVAPSPRDLRPPEPPILLRPEKPKGWIRRLSMPSVNVAFSLDAKKNASAVSLKAGLPAENGRLRKRSYEQGIGSRTLMGR